MNFFYAFMIVCWVFRSWGLHITYNIFETIVCFCLAACASSGCLVSTGISRVMEICCDVHPVSSSCSSSRTRFLATSASGLVVRIKPHCKTYRGRCEVSGDSEENLGIIGTSIPTTKLSIR